MFKGNIEVTGIELLNHPKIVGIATISLESIGKISGIKVVVSNGDIKCEPPNRSFVDDAGMRKYENVFRFERDLWKRIQDEIIRSWRKQCR